jgi:hypothetical protein
MGEAKNRDRRLGRSYLDRINAAREREVARSNRLARELEAYAAEVQAQAERIGMALGTTQIMAEIPVLGAKDANGVPVPTGKKETHPARVVLIGLDALLERLGMMERAVDAACPEHGENPACECVSCQIRKACGMMFKTAPAAPGPAPVAATEPVATSGYLQVETFVEPEAAVPAASAVEAAPERWDRETSDPIADIEEGMHLVRSQPDRPEVIGPETAAAMQSALNAVVAEIDARHFHDPSTPCTHDEKTECDDCNDCGAVLPEPAAPEEVPR